MYTFTYSACDICQAAVDESTEGGDLGRGFGNADPVAYLDVHVCFNGHLAIACPFIPVLLIARLRFLSVKIICL
jgi:hypothetical protein